MGAFSQHLHKPLWLTRPKATMSSRPWGDQPRSTQDRCARCLHCAGPTRTEGKYSSSYISLYLRALGTKAGTPGGTFPTSFGFITYPAGKEPMRSVKPRESKTWQLIGSTFSPSCSKGNGRFMLSIVLPRYPRTKGDWSQDPQKIEKRKALSVGGSQFGWARFQS